jgi:hypothetical protein
MRPEAKNDCAGKGQQQFNRPTNQLVHELLVSSGTSWLACDESPLLAFAT